jgi:hypothetical protein
MAKKNKSSVNSDMQMKAVVLCALIIAFCIGFFVARLRYKPQLIQLTKMVQDKDAALQQIQSENNHVSMKNGKMWVVENGNAKEMTSDTSLLNGDSVGVDGKVTRADGSEVTLQNGESIDMSGNISTPTPQPSE